MEPSSIRPLELALNELITWGAFGGRDWTRVSGPLKFVTS